MENSLLPKVKEIIESIYSTLA